MKIRELLLHPIAVADGPLRSSYGLHAPYALRTIVELKTSDGLTGISETYGGDKQLAAFERLVSLAEGGAQILVYKGLPVDVPGWGGLDVRRDTLHQWMDRLHFVEKENGIGQAEIGKGAFVRGDDLMLVVFVDTDAEAGLAECPLVEETLWFHDTVHQLELRQLPVDSMVQ